MNQPVLLCGLGRVGFRILQHLKAAGVPVSVISENDPTDPQLAGVPFIKGDCRRPELLEQAGLKTARGVIIVTSDDLVNVSTAMLVRKLNPDVRVVVRMFNQNLIPRLGAAMKNTVALSVSALTAPLIALTALTGDTLGVFKLDDVPHQVAEVVVPENSPLVHARLGDLAKQHKLMILSHTPSGGEAKLWEAVSGDTRLAVGDHFVACGRPEDLAPILVDEDGNLFGGVRWAGWLRRQLRTVGRTLGAIDLPVRLASAGLFFTLFVSTLMFRYGVGTDWADGLYQTVSIVATGGELHAESRPPWAKVFVSVLKIAGAALLAIFTALFTQYFIRAKLGGVLEARRIPDGGHVVVCGLGNVGFRCVEELVRLGHQVVAIENVHDNPFAETVRRLGAAVIIGDATVGAVLKQARAGTARSVIAATESELRNLEIGLLAREMNSTHRIVVRLTEPTFAEAVRDSANIKHAVSVPALAAPAFAAALYGDRVQTLITVGSRTLAIVELTVQPNDPCLHEQSLLATMFDYSFLPLGIGGKPPFPQDGLPKALRLQAGDKLTIVAELSALERLVRREPAPADRRVVVESYPYSARELLWSIVRTNRRCTEEEAAAVVAQTPFVLAEQLTAGESEELLALVERNKVDARAEAAPATV
ncbi:potassium channel family protein [Limnoglobus roseus]|uniref:TrkA-N n=1 Tax=Limnoglobus roseus TaxID=2598579 RepID=A0A5C1APX7_9BACT|nr:NAD-binding protein [Limnoglobus roseus]QEL20076.1 TrkA-N [Limnoglobus roseus]